MSMAQASGHCPKTYKFLERYTLIAQNNQPHIRHSDDFLVFFTLFEMLSK